MAPNVFVQIPENLRVPVGTSGTRLLEIERSKASFSSDDLKLYLHGADRLERMERILPILENEVSYYLSVASCFSFLPPLYAYFPSSFSFLLF